MDKTVSESDVLSSRMVRVDSPNRMRKMFDYQTAFEDSFVGSQTARQPFDGFSDNIRLDPLR